MPWYAVASLDDALDATKALLTPLDAGQWLRLALVAFFLGSLASGPSATVGSSTGEPSAVPPDVAVESAAADLLSGDPDLVALAIVAFGVALVVGLAYAFVGSVMEFVFVESLRRQRVQVRPYADQHLWQAVQLFGFRVALGLVVGVPTVALALVAIEIASGGSGLVGLLAVFVPLLVLVGLVVALVDAFTTSFVVPVMIRTNLGVLPAWRRFWPTLTGEWQQYGVYVVVRAALGIAAGVLASVVGSIVGAVIVAPLVVVGVLVMPAVGDPTVLLANPVALSVAMLVALSYLIVVTAAVAVAFVPIWTYVRYHALLVIGDTEPRFDLIPDLRREIRERG